MNNVNNKAINKLFSFCRVKHLTSLMLFSCSNLFILSSLFCVPLLFPKYSFMSLHIISFLPLVELLHTIPLTPKINSITCSIVKRLSYYWSENITPYIFIWKYLHSTCRALSDQKVSSVDMSWASLSSARQSLRHRTLFTVWYL